MANVIVYSTKTCPYCHLAKEFLKANSIKFEDVLVDSDPSRAMEMIGKSGQQGVPVIDIDGKIIIGFDREAMKKALHLS
ncbi:MAG: glutaredoxin domain-containing protein [archaeon]